MCRSLTNSGQYKLELDGQSDRFFQFVEYSKKEKKWIPINIVEEMRKRRKKKE